MDKDTTPALDDVPTNADEFAGDVVEPDYTEEEEK